MSFRSDVAHKYLQFCLCFFGVKNLLWMIIFGIFCECQEGYYYDRPNSNLFSNQQTRNNSPEPTEGSRYQYSSNYLPQYQFVPNREFQVNSGASAIGQASTSSTIIPFSTNTFSSPAKGFIDHDTIENTSNQFINDRKSGFADSIPSPFIAAPKPEIENVHLQFLPKQTDSKVTGVVDNPLTGRDSNQGTNLSQNTDSNFPKKSELHKYDRSYETNVPYATERQEYSSRRLGIEFNGLNSDGSTNNSHRGIPSQAITRDVKTSGAEKPSKIHAQNLLNSELSSLSEEYLKANVTQTDPKESFNEPQKKDVNEISDFGENNSYGLEQNGGFKGDPISVKYPQENVSNQKPDTFHLLRNSNLESHQGYRIRENTKSFRSSFGPQDHSRIFESYFEPNQLTNSFRNVFVPSSDPGLSTANTFRNTFSESDGGSNGEQPTESLKYPVLSEIPPSKFTCHAQKHPGYYADVETYCQVFHICANGLKYDFLCPNGTIFDQRYFVCTPWHRFNCSTAESLYDVKENLLEGDGLGSVIAHAAGATGAHGPSAIYTPKISRAASFLLYPFVDLQEAVIKSNETENTSTDELNGLKEPLTNINSFNSLHKFTTNANLQNFSTIPKLADQNFMENFKPIETEKLANQAPFFSLYGQVITYRPPYEPEEALKIQPSFSLSESTNNLEPSTIP